MNAQGPGPVPAGAVEIEETPIQEPSVPPAPHPNDLEELNFCTPNGQFVMAYRECPDSPLCGIRYLPATRVKELFVSAVEARELMRDGVDEDNGAAITFGFGWLDAVLTSAAQELLPSDCRRQLVAGTDAETQGGGGEKPRDRTK